MCVGGGGKALCVLAVTRYNSGEKLTIEAGQKQQSSDLYTSMLYTQPHAVMIIKLVVKVLFIG